MTPTLNDFARALLAPDLAFATLAEARVRTDRQGLPLLRRTTRFAEAQIEWRGGNWLLFLPLAHCFARFIQYASIASDDGVVGYLPDTKTLLPDLRSFEPTYLLGVPRVFEKVYNAASHKAGAGWKGRLFVKAAEAARVWSRKEQAGEQHTFAEIAERAKYETLVYRTVRGALGPKIKYVACGGAPLSLDLAHFYNGIGLPMIQGYGMTETAAPFAATRVTDNVIGTVGQPAPGSSIRISDEGELQVKGPNVFRGYHNLPEKTAEAFTADGWLRTGDLAEIDDEGHIVITGRIKDIIITAGGKNVSPIPLEEEIAKCPIVEHCVVVGDQRPFIGALVTLDNDRASAARSNIVGDEGQVYLTGLQKKGQLLARWGEKSSEQCTVHYDFSSMALGDDILFYQAECR